MAVSTTATRREQLINIVLNELNDEQLERLLAYSKHLQLEAEHLANYDADNDPSVGFFSADPDLADHTEEILDSEYASSKSTRLSDNPPQA